MLKIFSHRWTRIDTDFRTRFAGAVGYAECRRRPAVQTTFNPSSFIVKRYRLTLTLTPYPVALTCNSVANNFVISDILCIFAE